MLPDVPLGRCGYEFARNELLKKGRRGLPAAPDLIIGQFFILVFCFLFPFRRHQDHYYATWSRERTIQENADR